MSQPQQKPESKDLSGRQAYNIVTDLGVGPNIRLRDNLFQAAFILFCAIVGAAIAAALMSDWRPGLVVGGLGGMVIGLITSGIFLMIFRFVRHVRGRHD